MGKNTRACLSMLLGFSTLIMDAARRDICFTEDKPHPFSFFLSVASFPSHVTDCSGVSCWVDSSVCIFLGDVEFAKWVVPFNSSSSSCENLM